MLYPRRPQAESQDDPRSDHSPPVERTDFQRWLPLWDGYNAFYGRADASALPANITQMT
jgi:GNAT superfamily N-acetyltransferase